MIKIADCGLRAWKLLFRAAVTMALAAVVLPASQAAAKDAQVVIAGAGPSTKVVERFVELLARNPSARGVAFSVPEKSIKHAGGIRSTEKNMFGRTGRPLNDTEKAEGVEEIFLAKMPIVFVVGEGAGVSSLSLDQVCGIFTGKIRNWKEVGGNDGKISVITREPTEALFMELKHDVSCMNNIVDTKYVLKKDDHVVEMITTTDTGKTAVGFGAARNFPENLHVAVDGFTSGVRLGLVYRTANRNQALVQAARETAASEEWKAELKDLQLGQP